MLQKLEMRFRAQQFKKVFRGYDVDEVEQFLDKIYLSHYSLITEVETLQKKLDKLTAEHDQKKTFVAQALITTQKATDDLKAKAQAEVDLIIREAEIKAQSIVENANADVASLLEEKKTLAIQLDNFRSKATAQLSLLLYKLPSSYDENDDEDEDDEDMVVLTGEVINIDEDAVG